MLQWFVGMLFGNNGIIDFAGFRIHLTLRIIWLFNLNIRFVHEAFNLKTVNSHYYFYCFAWSSEKMWLPKRGTVSLSVFGHRSCMSLLLTNWIWFFAFLVLIWYAFIFFYCSASGFLCWKESKEKKKLFRFDFFWNHVSLPSTWFWGKKNQFRVWSLCWLINVASAFVA